MHRMRMMAAALPLLAGSFALAGCTPAVTSAGADPNVANPITSGPQIGRCRMGGCSWFDIQSFEVVRETGEAALIRLRMRDGSSDHRDDDYPETSRGVKIQWGDYADSEHVFCSTRLPAYISGSGDSWEAAQLNPYGPSGVREYITKVYLHVCHPGQDVSTQTALQRLGYGPDTSTESDISLTSPEAIFDHLARMNQSSGGAE